LAPISDDTRAAKGRALQRGLQPRARWPSSRRTRVQRTKGPHGFRLRALCPAVRLGPAERPQEFGGRGRRHELSKVVTWCGPSICRTPIRRRRGRQASRPAPPESKSLHCADNIARTSPATLWSAAGRRPSARLLRNWAVRCRIPILCRRDVAEGLAKASKRPAQHVGIVGFLNH
jgi:hypothetical protein